MNHTWQWTHWARIVTRDGLRVTGTTRDGFHIERASDDLLLASYYDEADPYEALCRYRSQVRLAQMGE